MDNRKIEMIKKPNNQDYSQNKTGFGQAYYT